MEDEPRVQAPEGAEHMLQRMQAAGDQIEQIIADLLGDGVHPLGVAAILDGTKNKLLLGMFE